ncbi:MULTISPECIES: DUF3291 domain-containing protein [Pseudoalteromonas]|uniref:DUF3291 domain-containing protein n=1 Tax=Pseudoalteromonas rubra TaxID=43658 RepID=A0A0L0EQK6_9GAMM|nr:MULTISPECIES: DUF3291 domain-containing protein [Pseudoalteromonas]ALU42102.1 hypothetical protein AT705_03625 [Pseudoalteromonas rubra]KNC66655.1 hypothetical protein AC626_15585 [Pseudoalteromonas rubra]MDK1311004.1 DUF3291 domain-containing protein [Pseudoalteromonas sp. R96]
MKLAQLNIALAKYPLDSLEMKDFVDNLDLINGIAESSEGFIWRLKDESGDATSIKAFDDPNMIVNMSVWESVDALKNFMFRTHHRDFMRRKSEWFHRLPEDTYVLWWIEDNQTPDLNEAKERLEHLRKMGDTAYAFTFKANFTESEAKSLRKGLVD